MNGSDFIWQLVKSLSKQEIEWFYRVASIRDHNGKEETPVYIEFFRNLRDQETYDEKALRKIFIVNNFAELKARLRDVIYKAIIFYRQSPQKIRNSECTQIEWLLEKGFLDESSKHIRRARKRVVAEEGFLSHLALIDLEVALLLKDLQKKEVDDMIDTLEQERQSILERYTNLSAFKGLYQSIYPKIKKGFTPKGVFARQYIEIIQSHPLLGSPEKALSNRALLYFFRLQYIAQYLSGDFQASYEILIQTISNYENNPYLIEEFYSEYSVRKYQLALSYFNESQYEKGKSQLQIFYLKRNSESLAFDYYYAGMLDYISQSEDYSKLSSLVRSVAIGIEKFQDAIPINRRYIIWLYLGQIYYSQKNPEKASVYFRNIINTPAKKFRVDIQGTARILMVLIQFELDDQEGMDYYIRMASQFLYRRKAIFPFERSLLNFFRLAVRDVNPENRLQALEKLSQNTSQLLKEDTTIRAFHFFDYQDWIDRTIRDFKRQIKSSS